MALGHLVRASGPVRGAVVLVHDVWGLYEHFRELARRLAQAGFTTLAIDLYRRTPQLKIDEPGAFMRELSDPEVLSDVQRGVNLLRKDTASAPRVAVVGFCMGGMYALLAGATLEQVSAVVRFYGILSHAHGLLFSPTGLDPRMKPREPLEAARELRCPLLAFYGDRDVYVPLADIEALRAQLQTTAQPFTIRVVPGAGHAFMNETRPAAYLPDAAKAAWQELLAFLGEQLAPRSSAL
jgi:carboxymethylenebutenolidase